MPPALSLLLHVWSRLCLILILIFKIVENCEQKIDVNDAKVATESEKQLELQRPISFSCNTHATCIVVTPSGVVTVMSNIDPSSRVYDCSTLECKNFDAHAQALKQAHADY